MQREPIDVEALAQRARNGPCFVCEMLRGNPDYRHYVFYEDEVAVAFLNKYPTLYGYSVVVPHEHREQVTGDFPLDEYLALQKAVHRVSEAVRVELGAERMYLMSLGSNQGNAHAHWHVAPLPPGVPYERQQFHALMAEHGTLRFSDQDMAALAQRLRRRLAG